MDIKSRIVQAKRAFYKKKRLFTANTVNLNTRETLIKSFVCPPYGSNMDDTQSEKIKDRSF